MVVSYLAIYGSVAIVVLVICAALIESYFRSASFGEGLACSSACIFGPAVSLSLLLILRKLYVEPCLLYFVRGAIIGASLVLSCETLAEAFLLWLNRAFGVTFDHGIVFSLIWNCLTAALQTRITILVTLIGTTFTTNLVAPLSAQASDPSEFMYLATCSALGCHFITSTTHAYSLIFLSSKTLKDIDQTIIASLHFAVPINAIIVGICATRFAIDIKEPEKAGCVDWVKVIAKPIGFHVVIAAAITLVYSWLKLPVAIAGASLLLANLQKNVSSIPKTWNSNSPCHRDDIAELDSFMKESVI